MPEVENFDETGATVAWTVASDAEEILRLRLLVDEKDQALVQAAATVSELQQQVEAISPQAEPSRGTLSLEAQQEVARQRKEWLRIQKILEKEHAQRNSELIALRGQSFRIQQQLEVESRARRTDAAKSSAKIATLERSLAEALGEVSKARAAAAKASGRRSVGIAAAGVFVVMGAVAAWMQFPAKASGSLAAAAPPVGVRPGSAVAVVEHRLAPTGFQGSLGRLNQALSSFGNKSPEEIIREVRLRSPDHSVCPFQWNNGQPSLLFGNAGAKQGLSSALNSCAVAVEQYKQSTQSQKSPGQ